MTPDEFRKLALALPRAEERSHMGHPDFRVGGKVFASLLPGGRAQGAGRSKGARRGTGAPKPSVRRSEFSADQAMVRVPPDVQSALVAAAPDVWRPAAGAWGRQGCTLLRLADADRAAVREALAAAWSARADAVPDSKPRRARPARAGADRAASSPAAAASQSPAAAEGAAPVTSPHRIFSMSFASVYPLWVAKAERKGRTKTEVDAVLSWITGYSGAALARLAKSEKDLATFLREAPAMNPARTKVTGVVCGVRVENVEDPQMRELRRIDKLVDELAKGRPMEKILRS